MPASNTVSGGGGAAGAAGAVAAAVDEDDDGEETGEIDGVGSDASSVHRRTATAASGAHTSATATAIAAATARRWAARVGGAEGVAAVEGFMVMEGAEGCSRLATRQTGGAHGKGEGVEVPTARMAGRVGSLARWGGKR